AVRSPPLTSTGTGSWWPTRQKPCSWGTWKPSSSRRYSGARTPGGGEGGGGGEVHIR
ncbi:unnamed protein product, partial [Discosporangium mesarthrocarpum]